MKEDDNKDDLFDIMRQGQLFYSPLLLRHVLQQAGFGIETFELFFCDSDNFKSQSRQLYGIFDTDIVLYEFFVKATITT